MIPRPRDFTLGHFKYKSTESDSPPTDSDLTQVISQGLAGSAMPGWSDLLKPSEIRSLVVLIKSMSPVFEQPSKSLAVPKRVQVDTSSIARGEKLYSSSGCMQCHGANLRGGVQLSDLKGYPVISRDLTAPWTFRGGAAPESLWLRITTGMSPGPMPSYASKLDPQQRWDIVNFIVAQQRPSPWTPEGKLQGPGADPDLVTRGRYLVHAEMCGLCHTEVDPGGIYRDDHYLAGGMRVGAGQQGVFISRNLTPDPETGLGRASVQQIAAAIRDGRGLDGHQLNLWGMPWMYLHTFTETDATAMASYLKTLPATHNAIPNALHPGFIEGIVRKLESGQFPTAPPATLTYEAGAYSNMGGVDPAQYQSLLIWGQWLVFLGILVLLPFTPSRQLKKGTRLRRFFRFTLTASGMVVLIAVGVFIEGMPALSFIPPNEVAEGATGSIPKPDTSKLPSQQSALVSRGRYLYSVASCAYCHGNEGGGGFKLSGGVRLESKGNSRSPSVGTIYTANISSDSKYGLGDWNDQQIARAIRSGVSRDGRALYWQGMPWDHFSNWDEEDIRSIIAYLRLLPPVHEKVNAYRAPSTDDCLVYTFWIHKTDEEGCKG